MAARAAHGGDLVRADALAASRTCLRCAVLGRNRATLQVSFTRTPNPSPQGGGERWKSAAYALVSASRDSRSPTRAVISQGQISSRTRLTSHDKLQNPPPPCGEGVGVGVRFPSIGDPLPRCGRRGGNRHCPPLSLTELKPKGKPTSAELGPSNSTPTPNPSPQGGGECWQSPAYGVVSASRDSRSPTRAVISQGQISSRTRLTSHDKLQNPPPPCGEGLGVGVTSLATSASFEARSHVTPAPRSVLEALPHVPYSTHVTAARPC